ncbi:MAG: DUF1254 domain-containing protein [Phyllobacterium sp.]
MFKIAYAIILGLVGAAAIHIAVILLIPVFSDQNAWARVTSYGGSWQFHPVVETETPDRTGLAIDPLFDAVACHFALDEAPARIVSTGDVPFWSLSIYNKRGENIYSFNDRTAIGETLDLVVANPVQMIELKKIAPPELANSVMIEADMGEGFVVVRSFVPDDSFQTIVTDFLRAATCEPLAEA